MAKPATVDFKDINATFSLKAESKFFPHISTEAPPVSFFVNGVEKIITSSLSSLVDGIEEGKMFLVGMKNLISLDLYSVEAL